MSNEQKLREALQRYGKHDRDCGVNNTRFNCACNCGLEAALALPTAAPVGERERFEDLIEEFEAAAIDKHDCRNPEYEFEHRAYDSACQRYDEARAALSAGDAVDAQRYRWLREQHWSNSDICCVNKPKQNVRLGGTCPSGDLLDAAIDSAIQKVQS